MYVFSCLLEQCCRPSVSLDAEKDVMARLEIVNVKTCIMFDYLMYGFNVFTAFLSYCALF